MKIVIIHEHGRKTSMTSYVLCRAVILEKIAIHDF